jgi:hypothetical protein
MKSTQRKKGELEATHAPLKSLQNQPTKRKKTTDHTPTPIQRLIHITNTPSKHKTRTTTNRTHRLIHISQTTERQITWQKIEETNISQQNHRLRLARLQECSTATPKRSSQQSTCSQKRPSNGQTETDAELKDSATESR